MRERYLTLIIIMILCFTVPSFAVKKLAQTGFKWLSIPVSARAVGMGSAFIAIDGDIAGVYWNPATLSKIDRYSVMFSNVNWIADIKYMSFIAAANFEPYGAFAVHLAKIDYGELDGTIRANNSNGYIDIGTFSPGGYSIGLAYARQITSQFSFGAVIKYCYEDLGTAYISKDIEGSRTSVNANLGIPAFDLGTIFYPGIYDFRFAMSITNFSQEEKYIDESFPLPLTFKLGAAMDMMKVIADDTPHAVVLAVDMLHPRDYTERLHFGLEYAFKDILFLRSGYKTNYDEEDFSAGFGLKYSLGTIGLRFDYAYNNFNHFDGIHFFTVGLSY